jgi:hypothetical protein
LLERLMWLDGLGWDPHFFFAGPEMLLWRVYQQWHINKRESV